MTKTCYGTWCTVSGGILGHREAWLLNDRRRVEYYSEQEAIEEAARMTREMNVSESTAIFTYQATILNLLLCLDHSVERRDNMKRQSQADKQADLRIDLTIFL
jgi:hypothetical protein